MKQLFPLVVIATVAVVISSVGQADERTATAEKGTPSVLRHMVLFKFNESTPAAKVSEIEAAFARLPDEISAIREFEWGTNNSPEGLNDGFTHCFFVTFDDEQGRAVYLPHPAHQRFVELVKPHVEKVLVVDYEPRD